MEKLKAFGSLVLSLMSMFMLGAYADATMNGTREVLLHQWVLTSMFGMGFFAMFLEKYKQIIKHER